MHVGRGHPAILERLFELALFACPAETRREYGAAMRQDFASGLEAEPPAARPLYGARCVGDAVASGLAERAGFVARDGVSGLRTALASPLYALIVVVTVALTVAVGATVAGMVFDLVLRPLPYANPASLVLLWERDPANGVPTLSFSPRDAELVAHRARTLGPVGWFTTVSGVLDHAGQERSLAGESVGGDYLAVFGVRPVIGRLIGPGDARAAPDGIVLSEALWRSEFGADEALVGRTIELNGVSRRVLGVAPAFAELNGWRGQVSSSAYWVPLLPGGAESAEHHVLAVGRLRPGTTRAAADAELAAILAGTPGDPRRPSGYAVSADDVVVAPLRRYAAFAVAAVLGIVAIAYLNLAVLVANRNSARTGELAVRIALGATRRRLSSQLVIETGTLFAAGTLVGLAVTSELIDYVTTLLHVLPRIETVRFGGASVAAALAIAAAGAVVVSRLAELRPANLAGALRSSGRRGEARSARRLREILVVLEIAIALTIVVVAGTTWSALNARTHERLGFDPAGLSQVRVANPRSFEAVRSAVARAPGISGAEWSSITPFGNAADVGVRIAGVAGASRLTKFGAISPGYFGLLHIPIADGRAFRPADRTGSPAVAVVDEAFARREFGGTAGALGRRIVVDAPEASCRGETRTIVGVAGGVRIRYDAPRGPTVYVPVAQCSLGFEVLLVRSALSNAALADVVHSAVVHAAGPAPLPVTIALPAIMAATIEADRVLVELFAMVALIASVLAVAGTYAVVAFATTQRRHEFGVRLAVGARQRDIVGMVLVMGLRLGAAGVAVGCAAGAATFLLIPAELIRSPQAVYAAAVAAFLIATAVAAAIPAVRVLLMQPAAALRYE